jgi:hypothetical protein
MQNQQPKRPLIGRIVLHPITWLLLIAGIVMTSEVNGLSRDDRLTLGVMFLCFLISCYDLFSGHSLLDDAVKNFHKKV